MGRRNKGKRGKCGLENRIQTFRLPKNDSVEFVPYCNLKYHPGIIKQDHYLACRQKNCFHYFEFKLSEFSRKYKIVDNKKQGR